MQLTSSRLFLRPVEPTDVQRLFAIYGDPKTNMFNPAGPFPDLAFAEEVLNRWLAHWQSFPFGNWAICLREHPDEVIGFGGLSVREFAGKPVNNLGYRLAKEAWGNGFATEFARRVIAYGFDECQLPVIDAAVRQDHIASQQVLEKAGLRCYGQVHDVPGAPASLVYELRAQTWRDQGTPK